MKLVSLKHHSNLRWTGTQMCEDRLLVAEGDTIGDVLATLASMVYDRINQLEIEKHVIS